MSRTEATVLSGLLLIVSCSMAFAGDNPLVGTWKLKSYVREVAATGERYNERGEHPSGYLGYSADGRMYAIITWDGRIKPHEAIPTNDERAELYRTLVSYGGTYTVEADKVIHHVDISWNETWTGTDQVRFYKLQGNTLTITSAPNKSPADGREGRSILVWEKIAPQ